VHQKNKVYLLGEDVQEPCKGDTPS